MRPGIPFLILIAFILQITNFVHAQEKTASFAATGNGGADPPGVKYKVTVTDSLMGTAIQLARASLRRDGYVIAEKTTNPYGIAMFNDIQAGRYELSVHMLGYSDFFDTVLVDKQHPAISVTLNIITVQEMTVTAPHIIPITSFNLSSGNQVFEAETFHAPPTAHMTELVQENLMGTARAPTGEMHVRGMHGEYTYYVDDIPVPLGVFGGLNDVVDPKVIDKATFIDGGWPAEYGGQTAAVIALENRVPTGGFHLDASTHVGSYFVPNSGETNNSKIGEFRALNSNGQNLSFSDHAGKFGMFLSGSRQETDRRIDPPVKEIFHDHGFDYFLYGKLDYELSESDYVTANLNYGQTNTQVPYDSLEQIMNDVQNSMNSFQTLSYYRILSSEKDRESNLFVGAYAREGSLLYTPGDDDPPLFRFAGDTSRAYILAENRSFTTIGTRLKYDVRLAHQFKYTVGLNVSSSSGNENFTSRDSAGLAGPSVFTGFNGSDFGVFAEAEWHPEEWTRIDFGARYDQHVAPDMPMQKQISPRIKWNIYFNEANSGYLYYARLFMPTNVEGLRTIASNISTTLEPTLPERDDFYEAVYSRDFGFGLRSKVAFFYKYLSPGFDDQTIGSSAIKTPVDIQIIHTTGIEAGLSFTDPSTPFSGYINSSIIHAYGSGLITGGFLPIDNAGAVTDLDHDQRLSVVASVNYQPARWFANITAIYGSGLANGNPDNVSYNAGLFAFNTAAHTAPAWIINLSAGYTFFLVSGSTIEPSLYITNLLNHLHLIKGAYFSAASFEEPRNVVLKIAVHI